MSVITSARSTPRTTALVWWIISSMVTRNRVRMPQHHHAQAVAHQHDVDPGRVHRFGPGIIVGGQFGDRGSVLSVLDVRNGQLFLLHGVSLEKGGGRKEKGKLKPVERRWPPGRGSVGRGARSPARQHRPARPRATTAPLMTSDFGGAAPEDVLEHGGSVAAGERADLPNPGRADPLARD